MLSWALFFDFGVFSLALGLKRWFYGCFCAKTPIGIFWYLLVFFGVFFLTASGAFLATVYVKQGMFGYFWFFL